MNARRVTDATMRVRDALYEGLLRRKGLVLTEDVARERANNLATAVLEVLTQMAEEVRPTPRQVHEAMQGAPYDGSLFRQARAAIAAASDEPPPVRPAPDFNDPRIT